jgi:hypothetical protein
MRAMRRGLSAARSSAQPTTAANSGFLLKSLSFTVDMPRGAGLAHSIGLPFARLLLAISIALVGSPEEDPAADFQDLVG